MGLNREVLVKKFDLTHIYMYFVGLIVLFATGVMIWNQYRFQVIAICLVAAVIFVVKSARKRRKDNDKEGREGNQVHIHVHRD